MEGLSCQLITMDIAEKPAPLLEETARETAKKSGKTREPCGPDAGVSRWLFGE
jgi:hypothetical protein